MCFVCHSISFCAPAKFFSCENLSSVSAVLFMQCFVCDGSVLPAPRACDAHNCMKQCFCYSGSAIRGFPNQECFDKSEIQAGRSDVVVLAWTGIFCTCFLIVFVFYMLLVIVFVKRFPYL